MNLTQYAQLGAMEKTVKLFLLFYKLKSDREEKLQN